jgi:hypothetical protein
VSEDDDFDEFLRDKKPVTNQGIQNEEEEEEIILKEDLKRKRKT